MADEYGSSQITDQEQNSSYIKTSEGYIFPSCQRGNAKHSQSSQVLVSTRRRRRRTRSRSRSRDRERRRSSSSGSSSRRDRSRDRDGSERHRDRRDRSRSRDRRRERINDKDSRRQGDDVDNNSSNYNSEYRDRSNFQDGNRRNGSSSRFSYSYNADTDRQLDRYPGMDEDGSRRINGKDWKDRLTSIREAHFNRSNQSTSMASNQFHNDGSFMEMFKQKMQQTSQGNTATTVTPNSLLMASKSIPFSPGLSLPPLTTSSALLLAAASRKNDEDVDGIPIVKKTIPVPVSVAKRRVAKPLKTGIVAKKMTPAEEAEGSQEKLDAWAHYLQEVQKYKSSKCCSDDPSRPLVK